MEAGNAIRVWILKLDLGDLSREATETVALRNEVKVLRKRVQESSDTIRRIQQGMGGRGKKSSEGDFERHLRSL